MVGKYKWQNKMSFLSVLKRNAMTTGVAAKPQLNNIKDFDTFEMEKIMYGTLYFRDWMINSAQRKPLLLLLDFPALKMKKTIVQIYNHASQNQQC